MWSAAKIKRKHQTINAAMILEICLHVLFFHIHTYHVENEIYIFISFIFILKKNYKKNIRNLTCDIMHGHGICHAITSNGQEMFFSPTREEIANSVEIRWELKMWWILVCKISGSLIATSSLQKSVRGDELCLHFRIRS